MSHHLIIKNRNQVIAWLMICALFVASMVLVGGYTRLSGSGLSITQWKPIHGIIPPYNETQWQEEFEAYKNTPQYRLVNSGMSLDEFKAIFWPEFFHRLLGRLIGAVFFFPFILFYLNKSLTKQFSARMLGIFILGGMQGAIGWIMVKSGLQDIPYVNHIKLALHLVIAFIIFALILWAILDIKSEKEQSYTSSPPIGAVNITAYKIWFFAMLLQIIFGAFMAGTHAGLIYNTWPDMNGEFFPDEILDQSDNILNNITFIQFIHRNLAIVVSAGFLLWWYKNKRYISLNNLNKICIFIVFIIFAQFSSGVFTLIYHVPLSLALFHQMNSLLLWAASIWLFYRLKLQKKA